MHGFPVLLMGTMEMFLSVYVHTCIRWTSCICKRVISSWLSDGQGSALKTLLPPGCWCLRSLQNLRWLSLCSGLQLFVGVQACGVPPGPSSAACKLPSPPSLPLPPRCPASGLCPCSFLCLECSSLPSSCLNDQLGSETSGRILSFVALIITSCVSFDRLFHLLVYVCVYVYVFLYPQLLVQPFAHNWLSEKACWIMDGGHGVLLWKYFPNLPGRGTAFTQWFRLPPYPTKNVSVWKTAQFVFVAALGHSQIPQRYIFIHLSC